MSERILVIEDEDRIARLLQLELAHEGYEVAIEKTGRQGLKTGLSEAWDVILLDIMLPELNGIEVLRRFRNTNQTTPIIIITARDSIPDKVNGLDQGANDYVTKPFEIEEVLARIRSCIRLAKHIHEQNMEPSPKTLKVNSLVVKHRSHEVFREGKRIILTPREFDLLVYLMENWNLVVTREQIIQHVWGYNFTGDTNVVDVYIRYLRKKIDYDFDTHLIQTIRGIGYSMRESAK
ncbi:response regulator transcription factor [Fodinisporobacter ferrooxydans]|uniref:Response regulator transcription factor n=1 Tax=Fodinisporobacter ferrooxydans TaxID=2901836 RepID=A0ABY4CPY0_9BACL|nr:response regulator transcription factor [Alicyclobacillaceae bacterium MYW30-H2]